MKREVHTFKNKKIIIFGTGSTAKHIYDRISNPIAYFIDNDNTKHGTSFLELEIKSPDSIIDEDIKNIVVIIGSMYYKEISDQLKKFGLKEELHYWNGMELLVNPLNKKVKEVIEEEANMISDKCLRLINKNMLEDALAMLDEYEKIVPLDNRIRYLKSLIALKQGKLSLAESLILEGLDLSNISVRTHQQLHEVIGLERNGKYLKAVEFCEDMFIQSGDLAEKRILADKITSLEDNYRDEIQRQLEERITEYDTSGNYYLHLMIDNFYNEKFINYIQEKINKEEHVFIVFSNSSLKYMTLHENMHVFSYDTLNSKEKGQTILDIVSNSKSIFIHFLSDPVCRFLAKNKINKSVNWIIWGGDLYQSIDVELYDKDTESFLHSNGLRQRNNKVNNIEDLIFRKKVIRNLTSMLTWVKGDYDLVKEKYITKSTHQRFFYPNPVDYNLLEIAKNSETPEYIREIKKKYQYIFLLGNSGDCSNNHLEVLKNLKRVNNNKFCVIAPLSYGNKKYILEIIKKGQELLGEQFLPLTNFLEPIEYAKLLNNIDVAFMNHNRQQAAANIRALLYFGKKVFMKSKVTTYKEFKKNGIDIEDIGVLNTVDSINSILNFTGKDYKNIILRMFNDNDLKMFF